MSDPTIFDLSVREQLDAVAMTRAYLDAVEWKNRDPTGGHARHGFAPVVP